MKKLLRILMVLATIFIAFEVYASDLVNVNTATVEQLQTVKGIGKKTAKSLVTYRTKHGDFKSVEDLLAVKGIGDKKLRKIKSYLTIEKLSN